MATSPENNHPGASDSISPSTASGDSLAANPDDSLYSDYSNFFLVIADTGKDYFFLRQKMFQIHHLLKVEIDTMGRGYNSAKKLIALPENDEDEMYAGNYFPRRFPSENLSLEYYNFYQPTAGEETMVLLCGIYESEVDAKRFLNRLLNVEKKAFLLSSRIYTGCMH